MKKAGKRILLLVVPLLVLTLCLGCGKGAYSPKPVKDPAIVGVYAFSHAYVPDEYRTEQSASGAAGMLMNQMGGAAVDSLGQEFFGSSWTFGEDGKFVCALTADPTEVIESGCYEYDGETLKLFDEEGNGFQLFQKVNEFRFYKGIFTITIPEKKLALMFIRPAETSSTEAQ